MNYSNEKPKRFHTENHFELLCLEYVFFSENIYICKEPTLKRNAYEILENFWEYTVIQFHGAAQCSRPDVSRSRSWSLEINISETLKPRMTYNVTGFKRKYVMNMKRNDQLVHLRNFTLVTLQE